MNKLFKNLIGLHVELYQLQPLLVVVSFGLNKDSAFFEYVRGANPK